jgi:uncharacterized protein (DUF736 family)
MAEVRMNKGYLNTNKYKDNPKKPDFVGKIRVDVEFIRALTESAKSGEAYVYLSGWAGQSKDGSDYVSLHLEGRKFQAKGGGSFKNFSKPSEPSSGGSAPDGEIDVMAMLD